MTENYYQILEIQKTATIGEIKSAYLRLALRWHPDKNPTNKEEAEEKFKKINEAYSTLINPIKKSEYDTSMFVGEFSSDFDTQSLFDIELSKWSVFGSREGSIHSSGGAVIGLDDNSTREYQEAKRRIIENIKRTINDWKCKPIVTSPGQVDDLLVHKSFKLIHDDYGYLVVDYGKVHWKKGFTKQEWTMIFSSQSRDVSLIEYRPNWSLGWSFFGDKKNL